MTPLARTLVAAVAGCLGGCGNPWPASLQLGWSFADGQRCAGSGVTKVALVARGLNKPACTPDTCVLACVDGEAERRVTLGAGTLGAGDDMLLLEARSPQADVLYRGQLNVADAATGSAVVVLYFTGGR